MSGKYDDILYLPHPVSSTRSRMSSLDRAAQFSPFAALTGYEDALAETGRLTDAREETSELRSAELDLVLHEILDVLDSHPKVRVTRFVADGTKEGGSYVSLVCKICKIDLYRRELLDLDGTRIPMDDIWELELLKEN